MAESRASPFGQEKFGVGQVGAESSSRSQKNAGFVDDPSAYASYTIQSHESQFHHGSSERQGDSSQRGKACLGKPLVPNLWPDTLAAPHKPEIPFATLLRMLQEAHDDELASSKKSLEANLLALQQESRVAPPCSLPSTSHQPDQEFGEKNIVLKFENAQGPDMQVESSMVCEGQAKVNPKDAEQAQEQAGEKIDGPVTCKSSKMTLPECERRSTFIAQILGFQHRERGRGSLVDEKALPLWRNWLVTFVGCQSFDAVCAASIFLNSILLGTQADYVARNLANPADLPHVFKVLDLVYTSWFVIELLLRVLAYGFPFFYRHGWAWNVFDFAIVATDALQTIIQLTTVGDRMGASTVLRVLRVLRVTRALRVVRLVRFFRQLRIMVYSVMRCGTSLLWSLVFCMVIIYIFSILLVNGVAEFVYDNLGDNYFQHYREYWASLPTGMWTMFSCMTGGVSWMEVGRPLKHIGWVYGLVLGFYMFFTIFVVTNIVTGIFVDTAIRSAQTDRDEVVLEQLKDQEVSRAQLKMIFEEADADESGTLTLEDREVI